MATHPTSDMKREVEEVYREARQALESCRTQAEIESVRVMFLGRKGRLTTLVRSLGSVAPEERPQIGRIVNQAKEELERLLAELLERARQQETASRLASERVDVTLPGSCTIPGRLHPVTQVTEEALEVFTSLGFSVAEGPEIEDDYHNFEALNIPRDHPARDMQDTFFVSEDLVLRTHTSPVQIRVMEARKPPLAIVAPGPVYRHDDDVTHSPMFHQIEGFLVDREVTFAQLKGTLSLFLRRMFGPKTAVRFRPSFFPFTEPSAEVDIGCVLCEGAGHPGGAQACRVCRGSGWLEVLGAGMINPAVFRFVGYDPRKFRGFAFGLGIERLAMLRYGISDIRLFFENDLRFLRQF